jgi:hypothetical protein
MDKKDLCEHTRIRLIAAAIGHQQCTATAANVIPIPGTERFIAIGAPAEVWQLLRKQMPAEESLPIAGAVDAETNLPEDVAALFGACGFEIRSTNPAEKHPLAVCGSLDAAGLVVEKLMVDEFSDAARDVLAERRRQVEAEGMTNEGDDRYHAAELPRAAASYVLNGANDEVPCIWPWAKSWWKPRDARANYVRAAALLLAEIERIDRAQEGAAS